LRSLASHPNLSTTIVCCHAGEAQLAKKTILSYWNEARRLVEAMGTINNLDTALLLRHMSNTYRQINHHVKEKLNEAEPSEVRHWGVVTTRKCADRYLLLLLFRSMCSNNTHACPFHPCCTQMEGALRALYKVARQHRDKAKTLLESLGEELDGAEEEAKNEVARALEPAVLALSTCALVHPPLRPSYLETTYLHTKPGRCKDATCSQPGTCPGNVFVTKPALDLDESDYGEMGLLIRHHKGNTAHARPKPYEYNLSADKTAARIYHAWATWGHGLLQDKRITKSNKPSLKRTSLFFTHGGGRPFTGDSTAEKWRKALGLHDITINGRPINLRDVRSLFVCGLALKHASQNTYIQDDELDTLAAGMGSSPTVLLNEYNKLYSLERERSGVRAAEKASSLAAHYVEDLEQQAPVDRDDHGEAGAADLPSPSLAPTQRVASVVPEPQPQAAPQGQRRAVQVGERVAVPPWLPASLQAAPLSPAQLVSAVRPEPSHQQTPKGRQPVLRSTAHGAGRLLGAADLPSTSYTPFQPAMEAHPSSKQQVALQQGQPSKRGGECAAAANRPAVSDPPSASPVPLSQRDGGRAVQLWQLDVAGSQPSGVRSMVRYGASPHPRFPQSGAQQPPMPATGHQAGKGGNKRAFDSRGPPQDPSSKLQARLDEIDRRFRTYYGPGAEGC
jgi:hypothetical protein